MIDHAAAEDLLDAMTHARVAFDGDAWVALFTEDSEVHLDPFGPPLVGHNALRAALLEASRVEEQVEFTVERHWVVPPTILASWHLSYVHRVTRARVRCAGFVTLEVAGDGRVARARWWSIRSETPVVG